MTKRNIMKRLSFLAVAIFIGVVILASCKDTGSRRSVLPAVTGATNELLVVAPQGVWKGPVGDTIKQFFGQDQIGLPQSEPIFDIINLPPSAFDKNIKAHRNVLVVSISSKVDSASLMFFESPWARSQKLFKISAPNAEEFYKIFDKNKQMIMGIFQNAERDRLIGVYKKTSDKKIFDTFKDKYKILLYCPGGYKINKDTADFVWISSETLIDSKGLIFFQKPYEHQSQLDYQVVLDQVNEELKKYIPGPLDSTWMALDLNTPMSAANYNYDGKHYALLIKGLWTVENDFMGGPFVLNVVLDQENNRIIYMLGYVYAPEGKKRNKIRQVESIMFSMQIDYPEEEKSKK